MNDTMLLFLVAREGHASTVVPAADAAAASGRDYAVADPRLHTMPILDFAAAVKEDSSLMETDENGVVVVVAAAVGALLDMDQLRKERTFQDNNTH